MGASTSQNPTGPPRPVARKAFRIVSYDTSLQSIYKLNKLTFYQTAISPASHRIPTGEPWFTGDIERESIWEMVPGEW
jgi:hypothetical protein